MSAVLVCSPMHIALSTSFSVSWAFCIYNDASDALCCNYPILHYIHLFFRSQKSEFLNTVLSSLKALTLSCTFKAHVNILNIFISEFPYLET